MDGLDLAPFHFSEIKKESIAWRPCPARVQGRGSQQDKARILSSVRAEADLWGADGPAYTASLCGREAIFHWISDPPADPAFEPRPCSRAAREGISKVKGGRWT